MNYPQDIEQKIDFSVIRERLRDLCTFLPSREEVDAMTFLTDYELIARLLRQAREMGAILEDKSLNFPQTELYDIRESLSRIRIEGLFLDEEELSQLRKVLDAVMQFADFFDHLPQERFPELSKPLPASPQGEGLKGYAFVRPILQELDRILDKYGRLKDNASPELARIRRDLQQAQGSVSRALNSILRQAQSDGLIDKDVTPTLREGRLVIPVPPAYKRKIGGIVHDESATGKTVYVEPQQVVEANNRIRELEGNERRERTRILQEFASYLRPFAPEIYDSQHFLAQVDFLHAKALLARDLKAIAPETTDKPYIDLREARHPILFLNFRKQGKTVVPLNLRLEGGDHRILVISGPNAGGKSVCLKTVALLQYMLQCGLPVPVHEETTMGIFGSIFIDIGDEQSIEDDLSTYSSHLRNMKHFLRYADNRSLVLIDEFGGGTEPLLGGAIAESVLQRLNENGVFGVITTHYTNLKHFAEDHKGVINGAMLYDRQALRPLFQLSIGQPGSSFAIEIARQIGLPLEIIEAAKQLIGEDNINYDRHLQDIARDKRYWADKRKQVHDKEKQLDELTAKYEAEMADIRAKRKEVINKAKEEATEILERSNRTVENTIRAIKSSNADKEATRAARQKIENLKANIKPQKNPPRPTNQPLPTIEAPQELAMGAHVRIRGQQAVGEIVELTPKTAVVAFGNLKSNVPIKKLEFVSNRQAKRAQTRAELTAGTFYSNLSESVRTRKLSFHQEIDLRGYRADEALTEVMNFIDDAVMVGASEVTILHGTGTGVLKQVIRDYLKMQRRVQSFHDGDPDKGGAGITIVEL